MRIEAYTQVQQLYKTNKTKKTQPTTAATKKDMLEISGFGKDVQTARAAVNAAADIRENMTSPIKASISNGSYSVSEESFAEKLLAKYNEK